MSMVLQTRHIPDRLTSPAIRLAKSWETLLSLVAVGIFLINCFASPYFLDPWNLSDATYNFTETGMIALSMALLIIAGEIDLSVASIVALSSTAMGYAVTLGAPVPVLVLIGLGVGLLCGAFNAILITRLGLPSIVITIGTMSLFRGISYIVLGDKAYTGYPPTFAWFGQGYVWWVFTVELVLFIVLALVFGVLLHRTNFGRMIYAIGNNPTAALFSGIRVARVKFILFLLTGLMSGVAAICLTSRLGSTRPSIAMGWELQAITMVVLGGVNILGGAGSI
ncbi:ABC transporter permease, partial [Thioclava sp. BHET1]